MKVLLAAAAVFAIGAAPAQAALFYAVDEFDNLVSFDGAAPGTLKSTVALTGLSGSSLLAMDKRVRDGIIYGLSDDFRLFKINAATGVSTMFATVGLTGSNFAFDFNPTNANLRITSNDNSNYVFNFATNSLVPGVNVAYGAGPLSGFDPDIVAGAYTNNDNDAATGTMLYVIDSRNDVLSLQNAATGQLTRVGALGVDLGSRTSFDIISRGSSNDGFVQSANMFYKVDLGTGVLTEIGRTDRSLFALTAAVPEPASWAMMIAGFGLVGAASRRHRRAGSASPATR